MPRKNSLDKVCLLVSLVFLTACGSDGPTGPDPTPLPEPGTFVPQVSNQFFPLAAGTTHHYASSDGSETNTVEVLAATKTILGIQATIVHDQVFADGELIEDTLDWYAQDGDGNVWYLGEDSRELENGQVVSTEGSWEAGVNGAQAGIIMWADPAAHVDQEYRQEFVAGEAEDIATVVSLGESVTVPFGGFTDCIKTEDRNPLETGAVENKFYCPGVGLTLEHPVATPTDRTELVDRTGP